jgi:hypothetical protein
LADRVGEVRREVVESELVDTAARSTSTPPSESMRELRTDMA